MLFPKNYHKNLFLGIGYHFLFRRQVKSFINNQYKPALNFLFHKSYNFYVNYLTMIYIHLRF